MKVTIRHEYNDDGFEEVTVVADSVVVGNVSTMADCPEDNNISRMGVVELLRNVVEELGGTPEIVVEDIS